MANFIYTGVQAGKRISGQISASDPKAAALELRKKKNYRYFSKKRKW